MAEPGGPTPLQRKCSLIIYKLRLCVTFCLVLPAFMTLFNRLFRSYIQSFTNPYMLRMACRNCHKYDPIEKNVQLL